MEYSLIIEVLSWVQASAPKAVEAARRSSDILLLCYLFAYFINRKGCYIVAFLLVELVSNLSVTDALIDYQYYLMYVVMYCLIYWYGTYEAFKYKTLFGYVIIILFEIVMALDAYYNIEVETFAWQNYEHIVMVIHIYIIATLFGWKAIRRGLGDFINSVFGISSANYNLAFCCYNTIKTKS
ncbi:MAG: hypothetical protein ACPGUE_12000 [Marinomonas sp.]